MPAAMKTFSLLFLLVTGSLVLICDCQTPGCELPSVLQGSWAMTRFGLTNLGFNATHVTQFPVDKTTCVNCDATYDFYCYSKTGTQYVLKSVLYAPIAGYGTEYSMYMCFDLVAVDSTIVIIHELTTLGTFGPSNRIKHEQKSSTTVPASCNLDTSTSNHGLLLNINSLDTYNSTCPADILGKYVDSTSSCTLQIDVCTDNTAIALSNIKANCSVKPLFTDASSVKCLYGVGKSTTTYLTVYHNNTGTSTEPFTCLAIQKSGDLVMMSQNPLNCLSNQTAISSTDLGNLTFSFSPTELCPILNDTTTTTGLEPGAIAGIVVGALLLVLILLLVILLCCCLLRKRRKKKQEEEEKNASDRLPIRDPDDSASVDSGYPTAPAVTFLDEEHGKRKTKKPKRRKHRKIRRKRRILGPNGEIIYEESNPADNSDTEYSDDFEEEDEDRDQEVTGDKEPVPGRKLKRRVRKYTRQRTGPGGQKITEEVESECYETASDGSVESWQLDPIRVEIHNARDKRKQFIDKFGYDPLLRTTAILTRKENDRRFQPERMKSTKDILKTAGRSKRKNILSDEIDDDSLSNEDRKTPFMQEYKYKASMDRKFDDEGFWDDASTKKTAKNIFEFDKLDAKLDGTDVEDSNKEKDVDNRDKVSENESVRDTDSSGVSVQNGPESRNSAIKSASERSLMSKSVMSNVDDSETTTEKAEHGPGDLKPEKEKARVQSAIRHLLTDRLFGSQKNGTKQVSSAKMGRVTPTVIFVNEYNESTDLKKGVLIPQTSNIELSPLDKPVSPAVPPVSTSFPHPGSSSSSWSDMLAHGLDKDKRHLKRSQKSHIHWLKTDYSGGKERRFDKNVDSQEKLFELVPGPHHNVLPTVSRREVNTDRQVTPISHTSSSRHIDVLSMSEWRLRKLLEELYKDKKYMDGLLDPQGKPVHVKELAHHGRDYLLQMADFWESKGILPPRPHQTLPGAMPPKRPKSSTSQNSQSEKPNEEASQPKLARNKSLC